MVKNNLMRSSRYVPFEPVLRYGLGFLRFFKLSWFPSAFAPR